MVLLAKYPRAMVRENPSAESTEDGLNVDEILVMLHNDHPLRLTLCVL